MKTSRSQKSEVRSQIFLFSVFCFLFSALCGCQNQRLYKETQVMMGTFVQVTSPEKSAAGIVFSEIKRIEDLLSKYNPDSEVSRLNKLGKLKVSPDTFYIIKKSKEFCEISDGAFDISVGPLVDLWGFTAQNYSIPKDEKIKNTLNLIGCDKIILKYNDNVVEFKTSGTKIDLGAIAKGYALDCAVNKLKERGIKNCLINAGGQVYALGEKFGLPWKVAIRNPRSLRLGEILALKDRSISTSGDYEQYFIKGNLRFCHILNPKTGYPADSGIVSVTVIAPSGLTADALSTAIFVLGKGKGIALAKKFPGTEVRIIEKKDVQNNR
jgi:thiamine biosynthesis lipoprotein